MRPDHTCHFIEATVADLLHAPTNPTHLTVRAQDFASLTFRISRVINDRTLGGSHSGKLSSGHFKVSLFNSAQVLRTQTRVTLVHFRRIPSHFRMPDKRLSLLCLVTTSVSPNVPCSALKTWCLHDPGIRTFMMLVDQYYRIHKSLQRGVSRSTSKNPITTNRQV